MKLLALGFVLLLGASGNGGGCSNPNNIGVQQYGTVVGRILDATNNRPVPNATVSIGSIYIGNSDPNGAFSLNQIPIGTQTLSASAPGYQSNSMPVVVHENKTSDAGYLRIMPVTGGPTAPPPATPTPSATTIPTPVPALTPQPAATVTPTPVP